MKHFFVAIISLFVLAFSVGHAAETQSLDISKLSAEQREAIKTIVSQSNDTPRVLQVLDGLGERIEKIGTASAKGLIAFAKEIGIEANRFIDTPLGKIVAVLVFLFFFGKTLIMLGMCVFFLTVFIISFKTTTKVLHGYTCVSKYEPRHILGGLFTRMVPVEYERVDGGGSDQFGFHLVVTCVALVGLVATAANV